MVKLPLNGLEAVEEARLKSVEALKVEAQVAANMDGESFDLFGQGRGEFAFHFQKRGTLVTGLGDGEARETKHRCPHLGISRRLGSGYGGGS